MDRQPETDGVRARGTGLDSLEGYNASLDDVLAAVEGEPTLDADAETELALAGYRDAMTYVLQVAHDPTQPSVDEGLLKALHFMMIKHDLQKNPGRWRPGTIFVRNDATGEIVYEGPDSSRFPPSSKRRSANSTTHRAGPGARCDGPPQPRDGPSVLRRQRAHGAMLDAGPCREEIVAPVILEHRGVPGTQHQAYYDVLARWVRAPGTPTDAALAAFLPDGALSTGDDPPAPHRGGRAALGRVRRARSQPPAARTRRERPGPRRPRNARSPRVLPQARAGNARRGDLGADGEP